MKTPKIFLIILAGTVAGIAALAGVNNKDNEHKVKKMNDIPENITIATFAGGCFWCVESDFEKVDGVIRVVSGYTGGPEPDPTYKQVASGKTGHLEAVQVYYDPNRISYEDLLDIFWRHVDPTDPGGQFVDRGNQYRTAIFVHDEVQKQLAVGSRDALDQSNRFVKPVVTEILDLDRFYEAEDYHQDYYKKSPVRYKLYRYNSGRDRFLENAWAERNDRPDHGESHTNRYTRPPDNEIRKRLTPLQYRVARENGTEPPFRNAYWDNKKAGVYVDIVSGEPLFSSRDKFDSGTGWPSFTQPLEPDNIVEHKDTSHLMVRTEVRSKHGDSHLGHVFDDGPDPTGLRYCINSAALRFVPKERLEQEGYGQYMNLFTKN